MPEIKGNEEWAEYVRSFIAIFIVVIGIVAIITSFWFQPADIAKEIAPILAGMIGIVLGYYFGTKGVGKFEETADLAKEKAVKAENLAMKLEEANYSLASLQDQVDDFKKKLVKRKNLIADYDEYVEELEAEIAELKSPGSGGESDE